MIEILLELYIWRLESQALFFKITKFSWDLGDFALKFNKKGIFLLSPRLEGQVIQGRLSWKRGNYLGKGEIFLEKGKLFWKRKSSRAI